MYLDYGREDGNKDVELGINVSVNERMNYQQTGSIFPIVKAESNLKHQG
jgi:hypothetical protein